MYKRLIVLIVLILSVMPLISVNAQTASEGIDYCEILQTDDCQILVQSADVMGQVGSFAFDLAMDFDLEGDMQGFGDMNFAIDGSGLLAIDTEYFNQLQGLAMSDPAAYLEQMPTMVDKIYSSIDGEAYLTITLPDMFGAMIGSTEIPINLLMKDGVYVVDVASLADAVGEDANGMEWAGIDLNGAFESMMGDLDLSSLSDTGNLDTATGFDTSFLQEIITITRLADSNVNGEAVAVFEMVIDYGALLTSGMDGSLGSMYQDMGMDQETIDMTISMLEGFEVTFNQYIGLNDFYNYRLEMLMNFSMDGEMMGDPSMDSMSMGFDMSIDLSDFNTPVDIELPEGAMIMPASMLMGDGFR